MVYNKFVWGKTSKMMLYQLLFGFFFIMLRGKMTGRFSPGGSTTGAEEAIFTAHSVIASLTVLKDDLC